MASPRTSKTFELSMHGDFTLQEQMWLNELSAVSEPPSQQGLGAILRGDADFGSPPGLAGWVSYHNQSESAGCAQTMNGVPTGWSVGSAKHANKSCKPCLFYSRPSGCSHGALCKFCHAKHGKVRARPPRAERQRCKQILEEMEKSMDLSNEAILVGQHHRSLYMRSLLQHRRRAAEESTRPPSPVQCDITPVALTDQTTLQVSEGEQDVVVCYDGSTVEKRKIFSF